MDTSSKNRSISTAPNKNIGCGFVIYKMEWSPVSFGILDFENKVEPRGTPFFYKQSIFDPRPENCLSFYKKLPQKIV